MTGTSTGSARSTKIIVITDLDGTLLDQQTYSYEASRGAIERLKVLNIPLILCSSQTRSEMIVLWRELGLADPFIIENGGALCFSKDYFPFAIEETRETNSLEVISLGSNISQLRISLKNAACESQVRIKPFGSMSLEEIGHLTGLGKAEARLAAAREYDEPFVVEAGDCEGLFARLRSQGYQVTMGDRFAHLTGGHDKGRAVHLLLDLYRKTGSTVLSLGLGNSSNDISLLSHVDYPVVVKNPDGTWDATLLREYPTVQRTDKIGPEGWSEAIRAFLASQNL